MLRERHPSRYLLRVATPGQLLKALLLAVADFVPRNIVNNGVLLLRVFQQWHCPLTTTRQLPWPATVALQQLQWLSQRSVTVKKLPHVTCGLVAKRPFWPFQHQLVAACGNWSQQLSDSLQSMLGLMPGTENVLEDLTGAVLNVNFPSCKLAEVRGMQMTHQSGACVESR